MTDQRYALLMRDDDERLTTEEVAEGWHWCCEWDYLLIHPDMPESDCCSCGVV